MLGTGDPLSEERVQSSMAVSLAHDEHLLIDTTSGTSILRQLRDARIAPVGIRHLFITHRHFDHAGGLAPLLVTLVPFDDARITVYGALDTLHAMRAVLALTIPGVEDWLGRRLAWQALTDGESARFGNAEITAFSVDHGIECMGLRIQQGGVHIVFSADTRPCQNLIAFARDADILIHEAFGTTEMADQAHMYGHSTATDAAMSGREAHVRRLLLTHFRDCRHADPAAIRTEAEGVFGGPVEIAEDLCSIEVGPGH
jgi:ribonuclease Z